MDCILKTEFIELDNLLKVLSFAGSGAEARQIIQDGLISVNGEVETRVRRKLRANDVVEFKETKITIIGKEGH